MAIADVETRGIVYAVAQTGARFDLPPVRFCIESGHGFRFQDYLSPDEADRLADALKEQARIARETAVPA